VPTFTGAPIVLMEDSATDAYFVRHALHVANVVNPLIQFTTAADARAHFADTSTFELPALFVMDVNLDGAETGIEFLRWLREQLPPLGSTPAMMLTGSAQPEDRTDALMLGAVYFLQKPIHADALSAAVQSLGFVITNLVGVKTQRTIERR
jgi:CheY-like chemotaxis protein